MPARRIAARVAKPRRCRPLDDGWGSPDLTVAVLLFQTAHVSEAEGQDMLAWAEG